MAKIKSHTFRGRRYKIDIGEAIDGICESPVSTDTTPVLRILADLATLKGLETCIHEALHPCQWAKGEDVVEETARDIAKFLWRLGFRLRKDL